MITFRAERAPHRPYKASTFNRRGRFLETSQELNRFLADVERRAYRIAQMSLRSHEDAQDAVQDAMFQLVKSYATRPAAEWAPLFYRILQSRIRDCQRRRKVRNRVISFFGGQRGDGDDELPDPIASAPDLATAEPSEQVVQAEAMVALEKALEELPARQREAFMLRILEGLDVAQTAQAMGCSEGSVKTHLSRAMHSLRESLGEHWS
ncbi:MAG: RNA polymerase sigma factor [Gammaproteobacteria bacterium]